MTGDVVSEKAAPASGSAADTLSIDRLDVVAPGAFAAAVAPLFEGARGFLGRLAVARPFGSVEGFFDTARLIAHAMPVGEQIELIDAHPRLGASPESVSALSFVEQGYGRGTERAPETTVSPPSSSGSTTRTRHASGSATASSSRAGRGLCCSPS